jgi:UDP-N-acetylglucosamine acyltransferase
MSKISPLAVIDPHATIGEDVEIGPFCVIGPNVVIGDRCKLYNNVTVMNHVTIGTENLFYPNVVLGAPPQDKSFKGEPNRLEIGSGNHVREGFTAHIGTTKGGAVTRIGSNSLFMVNTHIGHDAQIGNRCIFANNVMIAGHVIIGDTVNLAGGVGVHHFCTVGAYAYIGGYSRITHDAPPFCKTDGHDLVRGLNAVGLARNGFSNEDIEALEHAYRKLFRREKPFAVAIAEFETQNGINPHVKELIEFLRRRDKGRHGRYLESLRAK